MTQPEERQASSAPLNATSISVRNTFVHVNEDADEDALQVDRQARISTAPSVVNREGNLDMDLGSDSSDEEPDGKNGLSRDTGEHSSTAKNMSDLVSPEIEGAGQCDTANELPSTKFSVRNTFIDMGDSTLEVDRQERISTAPSAINRDSNLEMDLGSDTSEEDAELPQTQDAKTTAQEESSASRGVEKNDGVSEQTSAGYYDPAYVSTMPIPGMPHFPFMLGHPPGFDSNDPSVLEALASQAAANAAWLGAAASTMDQSFPQIPNLPQLPERTTLVMQNLPLNYRRTMLLHMIDNEGFRGQYDFVYLPIDFNTGASLGYAFVNLVDPSVVPRFWVTFDGYDRWMFRSSKVCQVTYCKWAKPRQGVKVLIERFRNAPVMRDAVPDECKPALFLDGVRVPFPAPTKNLPEPAKKLRAKKLLKAKETSGSQTASGKGQQSPIV